MKKIFAYTMISLAGVLSSGCVKEAMPQGSTQTESQVGASSVALESMLKGVPAAMTASNTAEYYDTYGVHTDFGIGAIHLMNEFMLEDLATMGDNPYYNRFYIYCMNENMGSRYIWCSYYWDCYYAWIKAVNDVIKTIESAGVTDANKSMLGQAYAYRAAFYLDLARIFEAKENKYTDVSSLKGLTVPIIKESTTEAEGKNNPRAARSDMYEFILSDLDKAEEYLAGEAFSYTKPSVYLAQGLKARAYLEMGYWDDDANSASYFAKAAEYADKVIGSSKFSPLTKAQWQDPTNGFNNGSSNSAWIWGVTLSTQNQSNIITYTAHISSEATWGYATFSHIGADRAFYEAIPDADWRKASWLSPEFMADPESKDFAGVYKFSGSDEDRDNFIYGNEELQIPAAMAYQNIKFRPAQGNVSDYNVGNCADHCLMRVEEMYFIKAEALAHSDMSKAKSVLESLVGTRNESYKSRSASLDDFLIDDLLFQKRIEFWGEGVLFFDYKRLDKGITRGYAGTNHAAVYCYNSEGRSPQWNVVITRGEFQNNVGITNETNNPDPSGLLPLWSE